MNDLLTRRTVIAGLGLLGLGALAGCNNSGALDFKYGKDLSNKILGRTPAHKFGDPADVGWAATYLASDAAKFVNGQVLAVDGGALIGF